MVEDSRQDRDIPRPRAADAPDPRVADAPAARKTVTAGQGGAGTAEFPAEGERMAIAPELMDRPEEGPTADPRPGGQT